MSWLRDFQSIAALGRLSFRLLILAVFGTLWPWQQVALAMAVLCLTLATACAVSATVFWGTSPWVSPQPMGRGRGAFLGRTVCLSLLIDTFHSETSIDAGEASAGGTPGSAFLCGIFKDRQF